MSTPKSSREAMCVDRVRHMWVRSEQKERIAVNDNWGQCFGTVWVCRVHGIICHPDPDPPHSYLMNNRLQPQARLMSGEPRVVACVAHSPGACVSKKPQSTIVPVTGTYVQADSVYARQLPSMTGWAYSTSYTYPTAPNIGASIGR